MSEERAVPLVDLAAQYASIEGEIDQAIAAVLAGQHFILGPEVEAFEREFASTCGRRFAVGCASGSDALLLSLMSLGIQPGDKVLCPAFSFFATAGAIARLGAHPVFVDIEPTSFSLDPELALRAAADGATRERLRAVLPVDLFGQVAELGVLRELIGERGLPIVEDAAQAIGAKDSQGHAAGALGTLACFSLYPSKNLGAYGDAGIVVTDDPELAERLRRLRAHGAGADGRHEQVGISSRLDALQAAVLRVKLRHLERWTKARRENADQYDRGFRSAGATFSGEPFDRTTLPLRTPRKPAEPAVHVYHQYVIRVPAALRDPLRAHLREREIATAVYYPRGLHQEPCFADLCQPAGGFPNTEAAARECVALPVHAELGQDQLDRVVESVTGFLSR